MKQIKVGNRIRLFRKLNNLSQKELGDKLGIAFQQVQKYEKNINTPSIDKLLQIANIFNISIEKLVQDDITINNQAFENISTECINIIALIMKMDQNKQKKILEIVELLVLFN